MKIRLLIVLLILIFLSGCPVNDNNGRGTIDYREEMREFVEDIASYARAMDPDFIVIPQNGAELISSTGETSGPPDIDYIMAIDGMGQESLFYGYLADDGKPLPM